MSSKSPRLLHHLETRDISLERKDPPQKESASPASATSRLSEVGPPQDAIIRRNAPERKDSTPATDAPAWPMTQTTTATEDATEDIKKIWDESNTIRRALMKFRCHRREFADKREASGRGESSAWLPMAGGRSSQPSPAPSQSLTETESQLNRKELDILALVENYQDQLLATNRGLRQLISENLSAEGKAKAHLGVDTASDISDTQSEAPTIRRMVRSKSPADRGDLKRTRAEDFASTSYDYAAAHEFDDDVRSPSPSSSARDYLARTSDGQSPYIKLDERQENCGTHMFVSPSEPAVNMEEAFGCTDWSSDEKIATSESPLGLASVLSPAVMSRPAEEALPAKSQSKTKASQDRMGLESTMKQNIETRGSESNRRGRKRQRRGRRQDEDT